jgi:hypothetical protein
MGEVISAPDAPGPEGIHCGLNSASGGTDLTFNLHRDDVEIPRRLTFTSLLPNWMFTLEFEAVTRMTLNS